MLQRNAIPDMDDVQFPQFCSSALPFSSAKVVKHELRWARWAFKKLGSWNIMLVFKFFPDDLTTCLLVTVTEMFDLNLDTFPRIEWDMRVKGRNAWQGHLTIPKGSQKDMVVVAMEGF